MINMKIIKIKLFLLRIKKLIKIIEFHKRIMEIIKNRIPQENHENHEIIELHTRITKIMKILEFHLRIMKIMKII